MKYLAQRSTASGSAIKKILAFLIVVAMLLSVFATTAIAETTDETDSPMQPHSGCISELCGVNCERWWLCPLVDSLPNGVTPHVTIVPEETFWQPWIPNIPSPDIQLANALSTARNFNDPNNPMIIALATDITFYSVPMSSPSSLPLFGIPNVVGGIIGDIIPGVAHISDNNGRTFTRNENVVLLPSTAEVQRTIDFDPVNSIHPHTGANIHQSGQGRRHFELESENSSLTLFGNIRLTTSGVDSFFNGGGVDVFGGATLNINGGSISGNGTSLLHTLHIDEVWITGVNINPFSRYFGVPLIPPIWVSASMSRGLTSGGIFGNEPSPRGVRGGGIRANGNNTTVNFIRGSVDNNSVFYHVSTPAEGGGIAVEDNAVLNIFEGAIICSNYTRSDRARGGGIYAWNATVNMFGGEIRNNTARYAAGGVMINEEATFNMFGGRIIGNTSDGSGGGVINRGTFNMYAGEIYNNSTDGPNQDGYRGDKHGGGISNGGSATFRMLNPIDAPETVAGIPARAIAMAATESIIHGNFARTNGGGVAITDNSRAYLYHGTIIDNHTHRSGGGMWIAGNPTVLIDGVDILDNTARENGGGIFIQSHHNTSLISGNIIGNTANNGGAIYAVEQVSPPTGFYSASATNPNLLRLSIAPEFVLRNNTARNGMLVCTRTANAHNQIAPLPANVTVGPGNIIEPYPLGIASDNWAAWNGEWVSTPAHAFTNHDINTRGTQFFQVFHRVGAGGVVDLTSTSANIAGTNISVPSGSWVAAGADVSFTATPGSMFTSWDRYTNTPPSEDWVLDNSTLNPATANPITQTINTHTEMVAHFSDAVTTSVTVEKVVECFELETPIHDFNVLFDFTISFRNAAGVALPAGTQFTFVGNTHIPGQVAPAGGTFILDDTGTVTFTLREGQSITIRDIPVGYQVYVTENICYMCCYFVRVAMYWHGGSSNQSEGLPSTGWYITRQCVDSNTDVNNRIVFRNFLMPFHLVVEKLVYCHTNPGDVFYPREVIDDFETEYHFVLSIIDLEGNPWPAGSTFDFVAYSSVARSGTLTLDANGAAEFFLRNQERIYIRFLPHNAQVRVVETLGENYSTSSSHTLQRMGEGIGHFSPVASKDTGWLDLIVQLPNIEDVLVCFRLGKIYFINIRERTSLDVSFSVLGDFANPFTPREHVITFFDDNGIPLPAGETFNFVGSIIPDSGATVAPASGTFTTDANGQVRIDLIHGQRISVLGVPLVGYVQIVSEDVDPIYIISFTDSITSTTYNGNNTGQRRMISNRYVAFVAEYDESIPPTGINLSGDNGAMMIVLALIAVTGLVTTAIVKAKVKQETR